MRTVAATIIMLLGVCGCGGQEANSAPAGQPTEPPTPAIEANATYGNVGQLRDAAVEAGLPCPNYRETNKVRHAAESAECSGSAVLSTYVSEADRDKALKNLRSMNSLMVEYELKVDPVLVGPNWIVNAPQADDLQHALGGVVDSAQQ